MGTTDVIGNDGNAYLYNDSGQLVTQAGWHYYNNAYYTVFVKGQDYGTTKYGAWFYVLNNGTTATGWKID